MGVETVGVFSESDKDSLHVRYADQTYPLQLNSYLDINGILGIAEKSRAEAIHPGYGFLSQNIEFAKGCEVYDKKFIGPSVENSRSLNTKLAFRNNAKRLGLEVVPGTLRPIKDYENAVEVSEDIGYPVIVKADGGGGGKGMRIVNNTSELEKAINLAESEVNNSFGESHLYIEKHLEEPRHIEFQVLGDGKGKVVHLGERECSIQRRYQKLIEETPSPIMTEDVRRYIGDEVTDFLSEFNYESAGTVEFLRDKEGEFYALEMNGRLQVEHRITEMTTGIDIVEEQIRIASGEGLRYEQDDIEMKGHAMDFRINAEDPKNIKTFKASPGKITRFELPPEDPCIIIDSAIYPGYFVSLDYDPLIAKVAVHDETRNKTIERAIKTLENTTIEIEGEEKTTIPKHIDILNSELFRLGNTDTGFIDKCERYQKLFDSLKGPPRNIVA
jgi:acetyl-CoA carboxylase biotin carboxylase subunit